MNRNRAPNHAAHDELLLARLAGGDLEGPERDRALELVASCPACAAAYADFEALPGEIVAMRVPARPRDFTLTPETAREARRRFRPAAAIRSLRGLGLVRSLGATMTAAGVAGILLVGAVSVLAPGGGTLSALEDRFGGNGALAPAAAPTTGVQEAGGSNFDQAQPSAAPAATAAAPGALNPPSPASTVIAMRPEPSSSTTKAWLGPVPGASPTGATGQGGRNPFGQSPNSPSGPEPGVLLLGGFGILAAIGLLVLLAPSFGRRWRSRARP